MSILVARGWNMTQRRDSGALEEIVDVDLISIEILLEYQIRWLADFLPRTTSIQGPFLLIRGFICLVKRRQGSIY